MVSPVLHVNVHPARETLHKLVTRKVMETLFVNVKMGTLDQNVRDVPMVSLVTLTVTMESACHVPVTSLVATATNVM